MPILIFVGVVACVVYLWREAGISSYLSGVAEGVRSTVTCPQVGWLQQVHVRPYQVVKSGDPIAVLVPRDPRVALDLLQSQLAIARLRLQPTVAEQNAMNFEQLRVDLLKTRSELAVAKVNLERTENDVLRNTPLYKEKLVSEEIYDLSVKMRDLHRAEVETKTRSVIELDRRLQELGTLGIPREAQAGDLAQTMLVEVEAMRDAVQTNFGPVILRAPISGMVSFVYRQQGENVVDGEPLLVINGQWADRIVGYLRQPYVLEPEVGMDVLVSTRDRNSRKFWSEVSQVGAQLETITNSLAFLRMGALLDAGLPVVVDVPSNMQIRPGEVVDLAFRSRPDSVASATTPVRKPPTAARLTAQPWNE